MPETAQEEARTRPRRERPGRGQEETRERPGRGQEEARKRPGRGQEEDRAWPEDFRRGRVGSLPAAPRRLETLLKVKVKNWNGKTSSDERAPEHGAEGQGRGSGLKLPLSKVENRERGGGRKPGT